MSEERKFKASHFENIQELIASCMIWIKTDDYDAYCRFFDMGAMEELIKELNNLKEIEKLHQEENGKLRVELEQEKEKNEKLSFLVNCYTNEYFIEKSEVDKNYISKDKIKKKIGIIKTLNEKLYYEENVISILEDLLEEK